MQRYLLVVPASSQAAANAAMRSLRRVADARTFTVPLYRNGVIVYFWACGPVSDAERAALRTVPGMLHFAWTPEIADATCRSLNAFPYREDS